MKYVKHKYSKRVYRVMRDHHPDRPYLLCTPFIRGVSERSLSRFFTPLDEGEETNTPISVVSELEWERRFLSGTQRVVIRVPDLPKGVRVPTPKSNSGVYTLSQICEELEVSPSKARKALRSKRLKPPSGKWEWAENEVGQIKEVLRNL